MATLYLTQLMECRGDMAITSEAKTLALPIAVVETAERKRISKSNDYGYEVPLPVRDAFTVKDRDLATAGKVGGFFPNLKPNDTTESYRGLTGPEILRRMVEKADAEGRAYPWGR